jgi:hypothetical protein
MFGNLTSDKKPEFVGESNLRFFTSFLSSSKKTLKLIQAQDQVESYSDVPEPCFLKLRYFAGEQQASSAISSDLTNSPKFLSSLVTSFFHSCFEDNSHSAIEKSVRCARSLYISAVADDGEETIVSALNFAVIGRHGLYVNWLATSLDDVDPSKFRVLTKLKDWPSTWRKNHLAQSLLHIAYTAYEQHVSGTESRETPPSIVLQCNVKKDSEAVKFYKKLGFFDLGFVEEKETAADKLKIADFSKHVFMLSESLTDNIHFMLMPTPSIHLFQHNTGNWGLPGSKPNRLVLSNRYSELVGNHHYQQQGSVFFPFQARKEDILTLSSGLDMFYVLFAGKQMKGSPHVVEQNARETALMQEYLKPSVTYLSTSISFFTKTDADICRSPKSWFNDQLIDFYARW